jgi:hypothetical protein
VVGVCISPPPDNASDPERSSSGKSKAPKDEHKGEGMGAVDAELIRVFDSVCI